MTCLERDELLFMLAHNDVSLTERLKLRVHLATCEACRSRLARHQGLAAIAAHAIAGKRSQSWQPPANWAVTSAGRRQILIALCVAVTLAAGAIAVALHTAAPAPKAPSITGPCRPDLPNDQCR